MSKEYLGQAMKFPLQLSNGSGVLVNGNALVEQSITTILNTPKGTRFMLGEYGSRLKELLFEPNDEVLEDLLSVFIYEAVRDWEKRAKFVNVTFERKDAMTNCRIFYRVLPSNEVYSFIYPFYREIKY